MVARAIVPTGIEAKAVQFAGMCGRDGYPDAMLVVKDGRVARMSLFDADGSQRFFACVDGRLCEYYMPDEGDAE
ncbi:MAG: hypothetical protein IJ087_09980 [Eggerthellaceae bacterium]|nr:hypothetical protein [Eggerthellaceae bacterium]